jgi:hypothetical protein
MNRTATYLCAMTVIAGLPVADAGAQSTANSIPAEILACANEKDVIRRLSCYDREVAAARKSAEAPSAPQVPMEQPAPVVESAPEMRDMPVPSAPRPANAGPVAGAVVLDTVEAPAAAVPAPPAGERPEQQAAQAKDSADDFGYDRPMDDVTAAVVALHERPYGELVISLDNGQVWEQKHVDRRFRLELGEIVTVRKGQVAGYRLSGTSNRSIQVTRIK